MPPPRSQTTTDVDSACSTPLLRTRNPLEGVDLVRTSLPAPLHQGGGRRRGSERGTEVEEGGGGRAGSEEDTYEGQNTSTLPHR